MIAKAGVPAISRSPCAAGGPDDDDARREFADLLERRDVSAVFQPLVNLHTGEIVALEALARGPESSQFASPIALFTAARRAGRTAELDWACRAAAFKAFYAGGVSPAMSLFINIEPESLNEKCPEDLAPLVSKAESVLRVFVEINERALASDPAGVLATVDRARAKGWGIAIDDVGTSHAPVAMLPVVNADLVKLDRKILKDASPRDSATVIRSVLRYVETTGAALLVEGIESEADAQWARALGATYGQGFHLGRPGPLRDTYPVPRAPVPLIEFPAAGLEFSSPFEVFEGEAHQRMDRELLGQLILMAADAPRSTGTKPVFLVCVDKNQGLSGEVMEHLLELAGGALLFVIFGIAMPAEPAPGARGVGVRRLDPMAEEWFLIVLSDQAPAAVFGQSTGSGLFDVVFTQSAELVHGIAHHLIRRIPGPGQGNHALPIALLDVLDDDTDLAAPVSPVKQGGWRGRLGKHG